MKLITRSNANFPMTDYDWMFHGLCGKLTVLKHSKFFMPVFIWHTK